MRTTWKRILSGLAALAVVAPGSALAEAAREGQVSCGVWIVYWDAETGIEEAAALDPMPDRLIAFEALFDPEEYVVIEQEAQEMLQKIQAAFPAERIWLSVVNDLAKKEGGYSNKDRQLLWDLLATPESRGSHIRELVSLAEEWQIKGIEIDYENIHGDYELWQKFTAFIQELYSALEARGIALRVCLEWDSILYTELPVGPEYSIMCYSLYGYHSGPGPKADRGFLEKVAKLYQGRKDCGMALATGGYDWKGNRAEREVSEKEAEEIFRSRNIRPGRDLESGAMRGTYLQDGEEHTVWYADAVTLRGWMKILQEYGFEKFDFFRLGGNRTEEWNQQILDMQKTEGGAGE